ncbi:hypothetical protein WUBG_15438 [Wuchereria bancrofti]|nr:hypothetical protein WUBG_15438 [Wuchereria bancrofti]
MITRFENNIDLVALAGIFDETLHPFGISSYFENTEKHVNNGQNIKSENLLKQSSLTNPWLYDYIAVYDDRCLNCCWPTDFNNGNVPFRRFLNVIFAKHIYPSKGIHFIVGLTCFSTGDGIFEAIYEANWSNVYEIDATQKLASIDEISFNKFHYRRMAEVGYDVLLAPPLSYLSRFTGLGQVKPRSDDVQ